MARSHLTPEEFSAALRSIIRTGALQKAMLAAGMEIALEAQGNADANLSGRVLNVRSGALRSTLKSGARLNKRSIVQGWVQAGGMGKRGNVAYAAVHETGKPKIIKPKTGKYLRIPLPPAKTGAGVDRYQGSLRDQAPDKFFFVPIAGGRGLLIDRETDVPWYVLVRSVKTKKRPFIAPAIRLAISKTGEDAVVHHVGKAIRTALKGGTGGA